jgi:putative ABC transport system substrate-binding protein
MTRALRILFLLIALPLIASAQSGKVYRIGLLEITSVTANQRHMDALLRGLREAGYVEGKNLVIDYRSSDGRLEQFPALARDLVRAKPDVIVARGAAAALAAKAAGSVPIVMTSSANPVAAGVVSNLARPGGNVTGMTSLVTDVHGKRLQFIRDMLPGAKRVGVLLHATNPNTPSQWREVERAAEPLGFRAELYKVHDPETLKQALQAAAAAPVDALLVNAEAIMLENRRTISAFAASAKLPVMYAAREFVEAGGLASYGVNYADLYYRAASYVDKILRGAKAGDLPIEQPTKLELVLNMRAAQAIGLTLPREFLLRADEVIQ